MKIQIGTSGYSYDDWRGVFYPDGMQKKDMLEYYTRHFGTVEINATYYTIPSVSVFSRMAEKTPKQFEFIVKTNQETTHRRLENESAFKKLTDAVQPLIESGKFRGFLAQFPYSFKNNEINRKYLIETRKYAGNLPLFAEFRNSSWNKPQIVPFLHDHGIGYVNVDEPALEGLIPGQEIATTETGYIRFHGRNEDSWWSGQGSARYDYEYKEEELKEWLIHISNLMKKTYKTYIYFNNHPNGKAIKNARQMISLLDTIQQKLL
ncbi:MAG: DUF72 domain-containing protein [Calditrichaceae bacterium]